MPEETQTSNEEQEKQQVEVCSVTRNDVELKFVEGKFTRGKNKGKTYPRAFIEDLSLQQLISYLDEKRAMKLLANKLKGLAKAWYGEATDDNGENFDLDMFKGLAVQISPQGEKISDLVETFESLQDDLAEVLANFSGDSVVSDTDKARIIEIRDEMMAVKMAIKNKRRKTKEEQAEADKVDA